MHLVIQNAADRDVIKLAGRIGTSEARELMDELPVLDQLKSSRLEVDLEAVEYMASAGLRFLFQMQRQTSQQGVDLYIAHTPERIYRVFEMTGFVKLFNIQKA